MRNRVQIVSAPLRLTGLETLILGALLTVVEAVQLNISMSAHVHDAITVVILLLCAVAKPITAQQFVAKLPPEVVTIVQAILGLIVVLSQSWSLSKLVLTIIGVVVVAATALGLGPAAAPPPLLAAGVAGSALAAPAAPARARAKPAKPRSK